MVLENPVDDALVGATFRCLIGDTFGRLRFGDRFFYDNKGQAGSFTESNKFYLLATLIKLDQIYLGSLMCSMLTNLFTYFGTH